MKDVFPKFIIEDDNIILSKCTFHNQLVKDKSKVKGGGWWWLDNKDKIFYLFGSSHEFGVFKREDVRACFKKKNVFTNSFKTRRLEDYSFLIYSSLSNETPEQILRDFQLNKVL